MNKKQRNYQTMHNVVLQLLAANQPIVTAEPLIGETVDIFKAIAAQITTAAQLNQSSDTGGFTTNKNSALDAVFTLAAALSVKAKPYARKINDAVLLKAVTHSFSDLHDSPDTTGLSICTAMATAIQPHMAALLPYKITTANLSELKTAITDAQPKTAERDVVDITHTNSTATLIDLFDKAKTTLIDLDDLIEGQLTANHKSFVDSYFIARRLNDTRGNASKEAEIVPPKA